MVMKLQQSLFNGLSLKYFSKNKDFQLSERTVRGDYPLSVITFPILAGKQWGKTIGILIAFTDS